MNCKSKSNNKIRLQNARKDWCQQLIEEKGEFAEKAEKHNDAISASKMQSFRMYVQFMTNLRDKIEEMEEI